MASSQGTIDYIVEQLEGVGKITTRRMFGEYAIYYGGDRAMSDGIEKCRISLR